MNIKRTKSLKKLRIIFLIILLIGVLSYFLLSKLIVQERKLSGKEVWDKWVVSINTLSEITYEDVENLSKTGQLDKAILFLLKKYVDEKEKRNFYYTILDALLISTQHNINKNNKPAKDIFRDANFLRNYRSLIEAIKPETYGEKNQKRLLSLYAMQDKELREICEYKENFPRGEERVSSEREEVRRIQKNSNKKVWEQWVRAVNTDGDEVVESTFSLDKAGYLEKAILFLLSNYKKTKEYKYFFYLQIFLNYSYLFSESNIWIDSDFTKEYDAIIESLKNEKKIPGREIEELERYRSPNWLIRNRALTILNKRGH
ncbi:hypothetical protein J7M23_04265 [Candidatus Sumerlaeota bacterium]|nr:hypothetical protein [Candidatus Sumerlaeota bacterium]